MPKQDITEHIERLEEFEERLGVGLRGLYATLERPSEYIEDYTIEVTVTSINKDAVAMSIDLYHVLEKGDIIPKATVSNNGIETITYTVNDNSGAASNSANISITVTSREAISCLE